MHPVMRASREGHCASYSQDAIAFVVMVVVMVMCINICMCTLIFMLVQCAYITINHNYACVRICTWQRAIGIYNAESSGSNRPHKRMNAVYVAVCVCLFVFVFCVSCVCLFV